MRLNPDVPPKLEDIINKALEKDRNLRYQHAADLRADLQRLKRDTGSGPNATAVVAAGATGLWARSHRLLGAASLGVAMVAVLAVVLFYRTRGVAPSSPAAWVQLTDFTDSAVSPALSPDGRMLAFVRGSNTFAGPGQIYLKMLPSGDPVQLTHDALPKLNPIFSPDGSRIAYTVRGTPGWCPSWAASRVYGCRTLPAFPGSTITSCSFQKSRRAFTWRW